MIRIAVILEHIHLSEWGSQNRKIILFEARDEVVTAIDEDLLSLSDPNYLCLWLLGKRAVRVYVDGLEEAVREVLEKAGIEVRPLDGIRDHPILQALLLKENG